MCTQRQDQCSAGLLSERDGRFTRSHKNFALAANTANVNITDLSHTKTFLQIMAHLHILIYLSLASFVHQSGAMIFFYFVWNHYANAMSCPIDSNRKDDTKINGGLNFYIILPQLCFLKRSKSLTQGNPTSCDTPSAQTQWVPEFLLNAQYNHERPCN